MSVKMMRKGLSEEQVKHTKTNHKSLGHRVHSSNERRLNTSGYWYPASEVSLPGIINIETLPGTLTRETISQRLNNQSETLKEKNNESGNNDSLCSKNSETEAGKIPLNQNKNIYSRHLQGIPVEIEEEDSACCEAGSAERPETEADEEYRGAKKVSYASPVQSSHSNISKQAFSISTKVPRSRRESQNSQETNADEEVDEAQSRDNAYEKLQDEELVEALTDPSLKTSLQKILHKRRSNASLLKSSSGLRAVNDDWRGFSVISEEISHLKLESLMAVKSNSKGPVVSFRPRRNGERPDKIRWSSREDDPKWDTFSRTCTRNKNGNKLNNLHHVQESLESTRTDTRSVSTRGWAVHSGRNVPVFRDRPRVNKVEAEETRVINPFTSKSYRRPCLSATGKAKNRSNTANSSPITNREKSHCTTKGNNDVRDFILMYAKVKPDQKEADETGEETKPAVRMISATPEFVVKSAIGQFLTSAFPSERRSDSMCGKEEIHEDKQRTKLLKIKLCMQQLASIA